MSAVVAEQTRGPLVENIYRGDAAVVDSTGRLLFAVGDGDKITFWRSSAKPIQAMPIVLSGAADAFGFSSEHLAVICSSHNGEKAQIEAVADALQRIGLTLEALQCGTHRPFGRRVAEELARRGELPGVLHNNCSGKHTGMLAICKHLGLPTADYLDPASAVQQLILAHVASVVGIPAEQIAIGVDGCGVPVFGLPLQNMAYAFARLADPVRMPAGTEEAGRRIRDAMLDHPALIGGERRICTELTGLPGRRFVAKSGAEGVYCVGILPEAVAASPILQAAGAVGGVGIAVKAEDGHKDIRHIMTVAILQQLGLLTEADLAVLKRYTTTPVKNLAGRVVGELRSTIVLNSKGTSIFSS